MSVTPLGDPRQLAIAASIGLLPGIGGAHTIATSAPMASAVGTVHRRMGVYDLPYHLRSQERIEQGMYYPYGFTSYYVPTMYPREVSDALRFLDDISAWIGPSNTSLVRSLFPTPLFIVWGAGGAVSIQPNQYKRLMNVHNVIEHIHAAAGYDARRTVAALTYPSTLDGDSALTYLMADHYDEAYLAAIRALRPAPAKGLVTGRGTRRALDATVAFLDED